MEKSDGSLSRLVFLVLELVLAPLVLQRGLLLAQPVRLLDAEAVLEDHLHLFQAEAGGLGEAEQAEDPAEETEAGVEAECTSGRDFVHEGQVGRTDEEVHRPVHEGGGGCANAAYCRQYQKLLGMKRAGK